MQRVLVNVSCDPDHARELRLVLVRVMNDYDSHTNDALNDFNEFVMNMVNKDTTEDALQSFVEAEKARPLSIPKILSDFRNQVESSVVTVGGDDLTDLLNRLLKISHDPPSALNPAKLAKLLKQVHLLRHPLKGSGRIAFGPVEEVRPVFHWVRDSALIGGDEAVRRSDDRASAGLGAGHQAAMVRMKEWGEEWAEEEDLPSESWAEVSTGHSHETSLASKYHKDVSISSQRIAKLKVAKRKSKFN